MSKSTERFNGEILALRGLAEALPHARSIEECYAFGLNTVDEIFHPDRFFVALADFIRKPSADSAAPGWRADLIIPIPVAGKSGGRFMLQYDKPRAFTESEIQVAHLIAAQCGAAIESIRSR